MRILGVSGSLRSGSYTTALPEYNGSMPGQMKQVVDWASRPHGAQAALWGKPVAAVGASVTDYGAMWAQDHLRKSLGLAGARVFGEELPVSRAPDLFGPDGELVDPETRERLAEIVAGLVEHHRKFARVA